MYTKKDFSAEIKKKAIELGFQDCGISKAEFLEEASENLKKWLEKGYQAGMKYMENHFEKRTDPGKLVDGAKSVISVILNYFPSQKQAEETYRISKYAYGEDYHFVLKRKLKELMKFIQQENPGTEGRAFVDSAPVMDREWAQRSGLGWIGKHSLLINKNLGSFVFIGELIVTCELEYDAPIQDYCGTCTRCMDSCPTSAIVQPKVVDSNKCISYHTIENKGEIPGNLKETFQNYIFGCDICQDVCPWNNKKILTTEPAFAIKDNLMQLGKRDFENMDETRFKELFGKSALMRTGLKGLRRNIDFVKT